MQGPLPFKPANTLLLVALATLVSCEPSAPSTTTQSASALVDEAPPAAAPASVSAAPEAPAPSATAATVASAGSAAPSARASATPPSSGGAAAPAPAPRGAATAPTGAATAGQPSTKTSTYEGDAPCTTTRFATGQVRYACQTGGRPAAKALMKSTVKKAKEAGESMKCSTCHVNTTSFELKPDAASALKQWL